MLSRNVSLLEVDCSRYPDKTALSITVLKSDPVRITDAPLYRRTPVLFLHTATLQILTCLTKKFNFPCCLKSVIDMCCSYCFKAITENPALIAWLQNMQSLQKNKYNVSHGVYRTSFRFMAFSLKNSKSVKLCFPRNKTDIIIIFSFFKGVTFDLKSRIIWHFLMFQGTLETVNWCVSQFVSVCYSFFNYIFMFGNLEQRICIFYAIWSVIYSDLAYLSRIA